MPFVTFMIRRTPKPKQSARFFKCGDGIRSYQPTPVKEHAAVIRADISEAWADRPALRCPVKLRIIHRFPWPKATPKYKRADPERYNRKTTRPDLDNLAKPVRDAMQGIVFWDDAQVWCEVSKKRLYDGPGETEVTVEWDPEPQREKKR